MSDSFEFFMILYNFNNILINYNKEFFIILIKIKINPQIWQTDMSFCSINFSINGTPINLVGEINLFEKAV